MRVSEASNVDLYFRSLVSLPLFFVLFEEMNTRPNQKKHFDSDENVQLGCPPFLMNTWKPEGLHQQILPSTT